MTTIVAIAKPDCRIGSGNPRTHSGYPYQTVHVEYIRWPIWYV